MSLLINAVRQMCFGTNTWGGGAGGGGGGGEGWVGEGGMAERCCHGKRDNNARGCDALSHLLLLFVFCLYLSIHRPLRFQILCNI